MNWALAEAAQRRTEALAGRTIVPLPPPEPTPPRSPATASGMPTPPYAVHDPAALQLTIAQHFAEYVARADLLLRNGLTVDDPPRGLFADRYVPWEKPPAEDIPGMFELAQALYGLGDPAQVVKRQPSWIGDFDPRMLAVLAKDHDVQPNHPIVRQMRRYFWERWREAEEQVARIKSEVQRG